MAQNEIFERKYNIFYASNIKN